MKIFSKKQMALGVVVLLLPVAWFILDRNKEPFPEYDWIEICTLEGIKRAKYDNKGNLLVEEWVSQTPPHLLVPEINNELAAAQEMPDIELDNLVIEQCWVRLLPGSLPAAGYFELKNLTGQALVLNGVESKAYASAILHKNVKRQGMLAMERIPEITIPNNGSLSFSPKTNHIMLEKQTGSLKPGDFITIQFNFLQAGKKTVQCKVNPAGALEY
ncbi:MAG: copper chaperone PCu(A)C [Alcaligenaceae bacterium]|nr:copper chaperone PCu(A)C [Alcaligenaceae bacterium]